MGGTFSMMVLFALLRSLHGGRLGLASVGLVLSLQHSVAGVSSALVLKGFIRLCS